MDNIKDKYKDIAREELNLHINEYLDENGKFDYDSYVANQTELNIKKIEYSGPMKWRLEKIAEYIKKHIPNLTFGICHGTRRGTEQERFKYHLDIPVIGTEISTTAEQFPDTIQWDFHEIKKEWLNNVSFIFSNSLDHSYDPIYCLSQWMKCISPGGKIFLQRGTGYHPRSKTSGGKGFDGGNKYDMFQCTDDAFEKIVELAGKGKWTILYPSSLGESVMGVDTLYVVLEKK